MIFEWQRREYKKEYDITFIDDFDFLLHLFGKTGSCVKVADLTYCNQTTVHSILKQYLVFDKNKNRSGKGNFIKKLRPLLDEVGKNGIEKMTLAEISYKIGHPRHLTSAALRWYDIKYKCIRGRRKVI